MKPYVRLGDSECQGQLGANHAASKATHHLHGYCQNYDDTLEGVVQWDRGQAALPGYRVPEDRHRAKVDPRSGKYSSTLLVALSRVCSRGGSPLGE